MGRTEFKKRKAVFCALAVWGFAVLMTGCGNSEYSKTELSEEAYSTAGAVNTAAYDNGSYLLAEEGVAMGMAEYEDAAESPATGLSEPEMQAAGRKLIKTVNITAETEDFDVLLPGLERQVEEAGGYIECISVNSRGRAYSLPDYSGTGYLRYASMTLRIPKEKLAPFLSRVDEESNVVYRLENVEDVTLQYVDLESHKKALSTEQERLLALMEQAETVEDIIAIEGRLSEVRYQLESMESQLRTFDNRIDYSTVYLDVEEVRQYTPAEDTGVWEKMKNGFVNSVKGVGDGIGNFAVWFVINIPYLVIWAVAVVIAVVVIRFVWKRRIRRKEKKRRRPPKKEEGTEASEQKAAEAPDKDKG